MFSGFTAYLITIKLKLPKKLFWNWLRAKWAADLKTVAWYIAMLPFTFFWLVGAALTMIGAGLLATKKLIPKWAFLPANLREKQRAAVDAAREYKESQSPLS